MKRVSLVVIGSLLVSAAFADGWKKHYENALKCAHSGQWSEARAEFQKSNSIRKSDSDRSTISPDNPLEPSVWRNGAPYSPNFLAAYCEYRLALETKDPAEQTSNFTLAETEFEHLLKDGQGGRATYFYLGLIDARLKTGPHLPETPKKGHGKAQRLNWKVDEECLAPEELSAMQLNTFTPSNPEKISTPKHKEPTHSEGPVVINAGSNVSKPVLAGTAAAENVPHLSGKFALIVGEDSPQPGALGCASYDAQVVRDALVGFAGYQPENVTLVQNATAAAIIEQAKALSAKVGQDAVVCVFYAGTGSSIQGRDYLGASDTTSKFDTETMVSKTALYDLYLQKGATVFSFFEVNRPIENGYFFGSETPQSGSVSQMEATIPDSNVTSIVANGHPIGLYANSFVQVLAELKSSWVPIYEFGWQLYNKMKRGTSGTTGGGGTQIPTLPVLTHVGADARF